MAIILIKNKMQYKREKYYVCISQVRGPFQAKQGWQGKASHSLSLKDRSLHIDLLGAMVISITIIGLETLSITIKNLTLCITLS